MQVILLERIGRLGQMGDVVNVKDGYARNFLLPQKKALRATPENLARFEKDRGQLEARDLELKKEAEAVAAKLTGKTFLAIRQAGDTGQLYGSVTSRDIAEVVTAGGFSIDRRQIVLDKPIKTLGLHATRIALHPEVIVQVIAQRRPLRGRGRAAGARRGRDRGEGGDARARDLRRRRRVRGRSPGAPARRGGGRGAGCSPRPDAFRSDVGCDGADHSRRRSHWVCPRDLRSRRSRSPRR